MKILIVILLFSGIVFSQTEEEQTKIILANYVIQLDKEIKLNMTLTKSLNVFMSELQAIKEPSEELVTLLKKSGLYKEDK